MRMYDLIMKKRNGAALTNDEIDFIVQGYTNGEIPDYQVSAFLMAVCLTDMSDEETAALTMAMAKSGDILDLSEIVGLKADKHSTGGVGDKTSLVLGPMVAALGVPVAKMSGRGLGHTGGTIDKLEAFEGFTTALSKEQFIKNVNDIKIAIAGQTANLAPADKLLYALRDVTATVDSIPLIASSIMSKKIASGADVIVLDVKTGSGAFMKDEEDAFRLADAMVRIGNSVGRKTYAVISDMDQPLGEAIGNSVEVIEAINTLKGEGPKELLDLCVVLGGYMLLGVGRVQTIEEGKKLLLKVIEDGSALDKFAAFVEAQGGNPRAVYDTTILPHASIIEEIKAPVAGTIQHIVTDEIGMAVLILGGGRETKESVIDLAVGILTNKKVGDRVEKGETIGVIHGNDAQKIKLAADRFIRAYTFTQEEHKPEKFIRGVVSMEGIIKF